MQGHRIGYVRVSQSNGQVGQAVQALGVLQHSQPPRGRNSTPRTRKIQGVCMTRTTEGFNWQSPAPKEDNYRKKFILSCPELEVI